uniref:NB-ARC domain-containing protein n=1 Tax=Triticum urartu TaxID=4572 RepID=A0A8R7R712_TRIUA
MEATIGTANWLIGSVLNHLSNEFVEAFVASSQLGLNSEKMKEDLLLTQGLLHEAQRRGVSDNPGLEGLLQKLSAKANQAEDALDELHYFIIQDQLDGTHYAMADLGDDLRSHARHGRHALRHTVGNCFACFSCLRMKDDDGVAAAVITDNPPNAILNPGSDDNDGPVAKLPFDRVAISKKIKSVIEETQSLCNRVSQLLHIIPHHTTTTTITQRHRITGSTIVQDTLYGRRDIFERTVDDILTLATEHCEILSVLPIVGPAGIGKTTFTQHLYNDKRTEEHFVVRVWVCVSTDFDELRLSQQVLSSIEGSNSPNQTTSLDQLQISIAERLKSKRFLIVFDDIWECNGEGWKKLLAPFMKGETKGDMVIVTTRFPAISEMVKTANTITLQGLEFDDFLTFFKSLIFEGNKLEYYQEDFDDLASDIANKLKGSPLAAKTVGRLLRKEFSREHWMGVLDNNEWQKQKNSDDIMPSLRISYDYLPFYLKKCFSYFSLFPEDFQFKKLDMTYFWIALGIIEKDENYIEELIDNGFLVEDVDSYGQQCYVIHDLLHELSRSVSSQECLNICSSNFRVDDIPETVRHVSVTMEDRFERGVREEMIKLRSKIDIPNLRALMIFREYEETIDGFLIDILKEIEGLRVLHIVATSRKSFLLNFSKLIHLRYLKIMKPFFCNWQEATLPSTLSRFYHLKFLDLISFGRSSKLPNDISRLINICHLFVDKELQSNVSGIGKMKCLQEVKEFCVKKKSVGFELRELGQLTELGGELSIHNLEKVATKQEATDAKLVCKRDLKELRLVWGTDHQHSTESDVLDALQPHHNLGALSIINHGGMTGPSWLCGDISIKRLRSLHLEGVSWGTLPPFGQLLHLTSLTLIGISVLREIRHGFGCVSHESFVHLKRIILDGLPEFVEWVGGANTDCFSRLEYISCKDCPNLCAVPFLECSVSYTNLLHFSIDDCPKLSLPPMPHTPTLTYCHVALPSSKLGYSGGELMSIDGYSGGLALYNLRNVETMWISKVSHFSLTELNKQKSLARLDLYECSITCHGLQDLMCLESVQVKYCPNFFWWPVESAHTIRPFPGSLKKLEIEGESGMQSMLCSQTSLVSPA